MPVIMVMYGSWLPPGFTKVVRKGGKITVDEGLAAAMVKKNPNKYKLIDRKNNGPSIHPQTGESENILRESGNLGIVESGDGVDALIELSRTDDHPGDDGKRDTRQRRNRTL